MNILPFKATSGCPEAFIVKGTTRERGYQYGERFAEKWQTLITIIKASILGTPFTNSMYGVVPPTEETLNKDMKALFYLAGKYCPDYIEWLEGIQEGLAFRGIEFSIEDIIMAAQYPSDRWGRPGSSYPVESGLIENSGAGTPSKPYCNGYAATGNTTKEKNVIVGVNGSNSDETPDRIILVSYNDDGTYFTSFGPVTHPFGQGCIKSTGYAFIQTAMTSETNCEWGICPEMATFHIANSCNSKEEAMEWIKDIPRAFATGNFLFGDADGNITGCETNSAHYFVRHPGDADEEGDYIVVTNHFSTPDTIGLNVPEMDAWKESSVARHATISKLIKKTETEGGLDIEGVKRILRCDDWYDYNKDEWHYNEPGSTMGSNLLEYTHSAFFNVTEMAAYFMQGPGAGVGVPAGAMGEFIKIPIADDISTMIELMMIDAFFMNYHPIRAEFLRVRNASKTLRQDFASQVALEELLNTSYRSYEEALNKWAFAYIDKHKKGENSNYFRLMGQAMTCLGKSQLYVKRLMTQLSMYEV